MSERDIVVLAEERSGKVKVKKISPYKHSTTPCPGGVHIAYEVKSIIYDETSAADASEEFVSGLPTFAVTINEPKLGSGVLLTGDREVFKPVASELRHQLCLKAGCQGGKYCVMKGNEEQET